MLVNAPRAWPGKRKFYTKFAGLKRIWHEDGGFGTLLSRRAVIHVRLLLSFPADFFGNVSVRQGAVGVALGLPRLGHGALSHLPVLAHRDRGAGEDRSRQDVCDRNQPSGQPKTLDTIPEPSK